MLRSFASNQLRHAVLNSKSFSNSALIRSGLQDEWKKLAEKQLKGKSVDSLNYTTSEVFVQKINIIQIYKSLN